MSCKKREVRCLPCLVNPDHLCETCKGIFCVDHIYEGNTGWGSAKPKCRPCATKEGKMKILPQETPAVRMYFKLARELMPQGYLNVCLNINDFRPGIDNPKLYFSIYHEAFREHAEGDSLAEAYEKFVLLVEEHKANQ